MAIDTTCIYVHTLCHWTLHFNEVMNIAFLGLAQHTKNPQKFVFNKL